MFLFLVCDLQFFDQINSVTPHSVFLFIYLFFAMNINQYGIHMEEYTDPHNNIHLRNVESSHHSLKFLKDSFPPGSCHLPCL